MKELLGQVGKGLTYRSHHKAAFEPHSQSWSIRDQNCRVSYGLEGRVIYEGSLAEAIYLKTFL